MSLQVSEIGISMRVGLGGEESCGQDSSAARSGSRPGAVGEAERDEIVNECVRRVLEVLHSRGER